MSEVAVRAALEVKLKSLDPTFPTAWENDNFTPPAGGDPYQRVYLLPARPDNSEYGPSHRVQGIFQVSLFYPQNKGTRDAGLKAVAIKNGFLRGTSLTNSGTVVNISDTPEIAPAFRENDRYVLPVRVRYFAQINS